MSYTRQDIFERIREVLVDLFEIEANKVAMNAELVADLDIDSIDAVDLMIELKSFTESKMTLEDFRDLKTIEDVVEAIYAVAQQEIAEP